MKKTATRAWSTTKICDFSPRKSDKYRTFICQNPSHKSRLKRGISPHTPKSYSLGRLTFIFLSCTQYNWVRCVRNYMDKSWCYFRKHQIIPAKKFWSLKNLIITKTDLSQPISQSRMPSSVSNILLSMWFPAHSTQLRVAQPTLDSPASRFLAT